MQSKTVLTDRQLKTALWKHAAQQLGPQARPEAIGRLAREWYNGPTRRTRTEETPVQRWKREEGFRSAQETVRRKSE